MFMRKIVVYNKSNIKRRFPNTNFEIIGEIGDLTRQNQYTIRKAYEGGSDLKIYPIGTHIPFFDRKKGYVFIDFDSLVVLYKSFIPKWLRKKTKYDVEDQV